MRTLAEAKDRVGWFVPHLIHEAQKMGMTVDADAVSTDTVVRIRRGDFEPNRVRLLIVHYPKQGWYEVRAQDFAGQVTRGSWSEQQIEQFCVGAVDFAQTELIRARREAQ